MSRKRQQSDAQAPDRASDPLHSGGEQSDDLGRLLREREELRAALASLRAELQTDRNARRAALNLIEDTVLARRAMQREEEERRRAQEDLAAELDATRQLQTLASRLIRDSDDDGLFGVILTSAVELMHSQMGSLQCYDEDSKGLRLLSSQGLHPESVKKWHWVNADSATICGATLRSGERLLVKDVEACDFITEEADLAPYRLSGVRAVQSTPLICRNGRVVGMISNLWTNPHEPQERELRFMDILARLASDALERRQHQDTAGDIQSRHTFLLELSDALRALNGPLEIQSTAARVLGERLQVSRALYATVASGDESDYYIVSQDYHVPEMPSLVGRHRANDFGATLFEQMRAGHTLCVSDVATDTRITDAEREAYHGLGFQSYVAVPLIKDGKHVAIFGAVHATPRDWRQTEIALVEETAERTWAAVERAQVEAALREAKAAAEVASRAKDRVLAVLSHELRTPLTPVLLIVGAMQHDPTISEDVKENLAMIRRNIELETKLIDDLLDVTRLNSGKVRLKPRPLNLNEAVEQACAICHPSWDERQIQVECQYDDTVGQITADAVRVQQVLWNLLKNAIKFTMKGGRIHVSTRRLDPERCEIRIRDTGIGIRPEILPRIFDVFDQGDPDITTRFGGLGLGLAITKALVELHGGSIRAESEGVGEGACFIVELPVNPPITETEETTAPPDALTPRAKHLTHAHAHSAS